VGDQVKLDYTASNVSLTSGGTYDAANEQLSIVGSSVTPTYDRAGNMTTLTSEETKGTFYFSRCEEERGAVESEHGDKSKGGTHNRR
jgi:hypothetical protein